MKEGLPKQDVKRFWMGWWKPLSHGSYYWPHGSKVLHAGASKVSSTTWLTARYLPAGRAAYFPKSKQSPKVCQRIHLRCSFNITGWENPTCWALRMFQENSSRFFFLFLNRYNNSWLNSEIKPWRIDMEHLSSLPTNPKGKPVLSQRARKKLLFQELNLRCIPKTLFLQYDSINTVYAFILLLLITPEYSGKPGIDVPPKCMEVEKCWKGVHGLALAACGALQLGTTKHTPRKEGDRPVVLVIRHG